MDALEDAARERYDELYLHAQLPAAGFYDRRSYEREGERFEEAGIPTSRCASASSKEGRERPRY